MRARVCACACECARACACVCVRARARTRAEICFDCVLLLCFVMGYVPQLGETADKKSTLLFSIITLEVYIMLVSQYPNRIRQKTTTKEQQQQQQQQQQKKEKKKKEKQQQQQKWVLFSSKQSIGDADHANAPALFSPSRLYVPLNTACWLPLSRWWWSSAEWGPRSVLAVLTRKDCGWRTCCFVSLLSEGFEGRIFCHSSAGKRTYRCRTTLIRCLEMMTAAAGRY